MAEGKEMTLKTNFMYPILLRYPQEVVEKCSIITAGGSALPHAFKANFAWVMAQKLRESRVILFNLTAGRWRTREKTRVIKESHVHP